MLALAGLRRLGLPHLATDVMPVGIFPPAPGQGAICVESRIGDGEVRRLLQMINDEATAQALACERAFLAALDGSCRMPIAGHAKVAEGRLSFDGLIATPDGRKIHEISAEGAVADAARIGADAGAEIRARAGSAFFEDWY